MAIGKKALVILSGGQDSTTALFWAMGQFEEVHAITFNYGQLHNIEIPAARKIATLAGIAERHEIVDTLGDMKSPDILKSTSPLVDRKAKLETYESFDEMQKIIGDRVEKTFVPMRNLLFLTIAANRAAVAGIDNLVIGVCEADGANYPDCRMAFLSHTMAAINAALGRTLENALWIHAPLIELKKSASVKLALTLPGCYTALAYSHTAYDGKYPPAGKDHASMLRAHGFEEAGVPDPLVIRAWLEGRMELPSTNNYKGLRYTEWGTKKTPLEDVLNYLEDQFKRTALPL